MRIPKLHLGNSQKIKYSYKNGGLLLRLTLAACYVVLKIRRRIEELGAPEQCIKLQNNHVDLCAFAGSRFNKKAAAHNFSHFSHT